MLRISHHTACRFAFFKAVKRSIPAPFPRSVCRNAAKAAASVSFEISAPRSGIARFAVENWNALGRCRHSLYNYLKLLVKLFTFVLKIHSMLPISYIKKLTTPSGLSCCIRA